MEHMTLAQMMKISLAMPLLLILSFVVVAQAFERFHAFLVKQKLPEELWERVRLHLKKGDVVNAVNLLKGASGTMPEALLHMLSLPNPDTEHLIEVFQFYRQKMHMDFNRRLGVFGTASFIAPLIGLMGTVLGIMRAFHDLASAGTGGPAVVAAGISEALISTAAGIGVAVFSAILYNYFTLSVRARMSTLDMWVYELAMLLSARPQVPQPPQAPQAFQ